MQIQKPCKLWLYLSKFVRSPVILNVLCLILARLFGPKLTHSTRPWLHCGRASQCHLRNIWPSLMGSWYIIIKGIHWTYPWFMSCSVSSSQTLTWRAFPSRHHWNISSMFSAQISSRIQQKAPNFTAVLDVESQTERRAKNCDDIIWKINKLTSFICICKFRNHQK